MKKCKKKSIEYFEKKFKSFSVDYRLEVMGICGSKQTYCVRMFFLIPLVTLLLRGK